MIPDVFGVVIAAVEMSPMLACGSDIGEHGISMRLGTEADVGPGICYQMVCVFWVQDVEKEPVTATRCPAIGWALPNHRRRSFLSQGPAFFRRSSTHLFNCIAKRVELNPLNTNTG